MLKIDYAIISATPEELAHYSKCFCNYETIKIADFDFTICSYKDKKILLSSVGFGTNNAAIMATFIVCKFNPAYILFSGTAGGISKRVKMCDVVIATNAFHAEIQEAFNVLPNTPFAGCLIHPLKKQEIPAIFSVQNEKIMNAMKSVALKDSSIHMGTIVSSDIFPAPSKEQFKQIVAKQPLAIDMETSALYQVGWVLNVPVIVIRGISNILNEDGTDDKLHEADLVGSSYNAAQVLLQVLGNL